MICMGCFLMGSSIIPLSIDDALESDRGCDIACISVPWILVLGWVFAFSALFTKTHRINRILHGAQHFRRVVVTPRQAVGRMLWSLSGKVIDFLFAAGIGVVSYVRQSSKVSTTLLSLLTALGPPYWDWRYSGSDEHNRPNKSTGYCNYSDSIPYVTPLAGVCIGSLLYALYEAHLARAGKVICCALSAFVHCLKFCIHLQ